MSHPSYRAMSHRHISPPVWMAVVLAHVLGHWHMCCGWLVTTTHTHGIALYMLSTRILYICCAKTSHWAGLVQMGPSVITWHADGTQCDGLWWLCERSMARADEARVHRRRLRHTHTYRTHMISIYAYHMDRYIPYTHNIIHITSIHSRWHPYTYLYHICYGMSYADTI